MTSSRIYYTDAKCLDFTATVVDQWTGRRRDVAWS